MVWGRGDGPIEFVARDRAVSRDPVNILEDLWML